MPWGAAIGGLAAGLGSFLGQSDANAANMKIAKTQMAFQERMSNPAVQRRMEDMRLAGINPLLAGMHEASSPAGATATMQNALGQGVTSAMQAAQLANTIKKTKAEVANIEESTRLTGNKADLIGPGSAIMKQVESALGKLLGDNAGTGIVDSVTNAVTGFTNRPPDTAKLDSMRMMGKVRGTAFYESRLESQKSRLRNQIQQTEQQIKLYKNEDVGNYTRQKLEKKLRDLKLTLRMYDQPGQNK